MEYQGKVFSQKVYNLLYLMFIQTRPLTKRTCSSFLRTAWDHRQPLKGLKKFITL